MVQSIFDFAAGQGIPLLRDEPMSRHTTFRVGGPARFFAMPEDATALCALLDYAQNIFGEIFDRHAIVTENRLRGHEFLESVEVNRYRMPTDEEARELDLLAQEEDAEGYLEHAAAAWFEEEDQLDDLASDDGRAALSEKLMHHSFFQSLMGVMDGKTRTPSEIRAQLIQGNIGQVLEKLPDGGIVRHRLRIPYANRLGNIQRAFLIGKRVAEPQPALLHPMEQRVSVPLQKERGKQQIGAEGHRVGRQLFAPAFRPKMNRRSEPELIKTSQHTRSHP